MLNTVKKWPNGKKIAKMVKKWLDAKKLQNYKKW